MPDTGSRQAVLRVVDRVIQGVTVTTARDLVTLDGVVIVAQDVSGDVWYFGEQGLIKQ